MLHARFVDAFTVKKLIDALKDVTPEINVLWSSDGIRVQAMDASHVSLMSLEIHRNGFESYHVPKPVTIGLRLVALAKTLCNISAGDTLTWEITERLPDALQVIVNNHQQSRLRHFTVKLMDLDVETLAIPDTDYAWTVQMPSAEFKRAIHDLGEFSDSAIISMNKGGMGFAITGLEVTGAICFPAQSDGENSVVIVNNGLPEVQQTFAVPYLQKFCKATPVSPIVRLKQIDCTPMLIEYPLSDWGVLRWFLAPKNPDG